MDLDAVKEEIKTICHGDTKMARCSDPLGHPVLLITGCLSEDPDYQVVVYPPEVEEKDIGQTGADIWIFEIRGDRIFQYASKHNRPQSDRKLIDQDQSALERLAWII
ncbi:hypothetical protein IIC44_02070, partial [Patescibacteria group bacterium]|nr:hypothetical protein [Patescibacteria group bacterium]